MKAIVKPNFEIVEMEARYLDDARAVYQWYVSNSTATFQITDATAQEMRDLLFFDNPKYRSFAALEDGRFAGYGIITRYRSREAFNNTAEITVYLAEGATGKGYGPLMVARLEAFAREQGMHALVAIISGENVSSCKLFERAGYAQCAHFHEVGFKFDRWIDLVCFEKILK